VLLLLEGAFLFYGSLLRLRDRSQELVGAVIGIFLLLGKKYITYNVNMKLISGSSDGCANTL